MFVAALFTTALNWKHPSVHQQMNESIVANTHCGILLGTEKK